MYTSRSEAAWSGVHCRLTITEQWVVLTARGIDCPIEVQSFFHRPYTVAVSGEGSLPAGCKTSNGARHFGVMSRRCRVAERGVLRPTTPERRVAAVIRPKYREIRAQRPVRGARCMGTASPRGENDADRQ